MNHFLLACLTVVAAGHLPAQDAANVGMVRRTFLDAARTTWSGDAPRPIVTSVWYPAPVGAQLVQFLPADVPFDVPKVALGAPLSNAVTKYPLIVLSHGTGGAALQMMWLGHYLAANGYIVAAVSHHGNSGDGGAYQPQGFLLWWERARDLTVAIDRLLDDSTFGAHIDADRIGAAGFSLGGYSVTALAGGRTSLEEFDNFCRSAERDFTCGPQPEFPQAPAQFARMKESDPIVRASLARASDSYRDHRIKAVYAIAPALGSAFTSAGLAGIRIPFHITVGAADSVTPPATNARRLAALIPGARLTVLGGNVGHHVFLAECKPQGVKTVEICRDAPGVDRAAIHRAVSQSVDAFYRSVW
jgi:predicted dienelactone hydrolase